jgi:trehalose 6-phosphate phosphatase
VLIEPKRFAVAVHTRRVDAAYLDRVEQAVDEVARRVAGLRRTSGKMIHEFRPDIDWNKGSALWFVYEEMDLDPNTSVPIYLGDDDTDEDALAAIATGGIGIFVGDDLSRLTSARYRLDDPAAVTRLLEELAVRLDLRD